MSRAPTQLGVLSIDRLPTILTRRQTAKLERRQLTEKASSNADFLVGRVPARDQLRAGQFGRYACRQLNLARPDSRMGCS